MSFSRIDVTEGVGLSTKNEHLGIVKTATPVFSVSALPRELRRISRATTSATRIQ